MESVPSATHPRWAPGRVVTMATHGPAGWIILLEAAMVIGGLWALRERASSAPGVALAA